VRTPVHSANEQNPIGNGEDTLFEFLPSISDGDPGGYGGLLSVQEGRDRNDDWKHVV
jgi:hypothetical protein